ncbi:hypothetical protein AF335_09140 [Streptomyces eurocidicus]|uniref:Peptidase M20 dimerisation domain-containing protein n=1 Tax=Streptomyces eurocidicus TaxID=66423 RepID=A0A2N8P1E8_STREU|nr:hypothetical protein AF335_09140 [Streptomyces eurocidicus]
MRPALELYLALHSRPELPGREHRTAARLAREAADAGFTVTRDVGGHGVVAVLRSGDGPAVMLRAELDALPVRERTGLPYASKIRAMGTDGRHTPVMHACGHDAHLAALVATARALAGPQARGEWSGTLLLVGQPAEETLTGARAMLADGLYTRFPRPDTVLAQHLAPLPTGCVAHAAGPATAAGVTLAVTVRGHGGHAALPWLGGNPLEAAAAAVTRLRPLMPAGVLLTTGTFHSGEQANVLPERADLTLGVRGFDEAAVARAAATVEAVFHEAGTGDLSVTVAPRTPLVPCQTGDLVLRAAVRHAHEAVLGPTRVLTCPPSTAVEDFAWYGPAGAALHGAPAVRTAYWMTGATGPAQWRAAPGTTAREKLAALPPNHSPRFAPDPVPTLRTAVAALTAAALRSLGPGSGSG